MKPGCVLLQASYGCESCIAHEFDTRDWLLAPTPDLKVYEVTEEQLKKLVGMTERKRK
jgi:hypothetical protein